MAEPTINEALAQLDPSNDEHWTSDGQPAVNAVEAAMNKKVTRKAITDAAPDFTREKAQAARDDQNSPERTGDDQDATGNDDQGSGPAVVDPAATRELQRADGDLQDPPVSGEAVAKVEPNAATAAEVTEPAPTMITPADPGIAPLDTTGVQGGGESRPAVGSQWDPGERVEPSSAEPVERPHVGNSFDPGPRVPPESADGSETAVDPNPGPHVPPVQANGGVRETVDPEAFQPMAATSPAMQEPPKHIDPTPEDVAEASSVGEGDDEDRLAANADRRKELAEEINDIQREIDHLQTRKAEVQKAHDALVVAAEAKTPSHTESFKAYAENAKREAAERAAQQRLVQAAIGDLSAAGPGFVTALDEAHRRRTGFGSQRPPARPVADQ